MGAGWRGNGLEPPSAFVNRAIYLRTPGAVDISGGCSEVEEEEVE